MSSKSKFLKKPGKAAPPPQKASRSGSHLGRGIDSLMMTSQVSVVEEAPLPQPPASEPVPAAEKSIQEIANGTFELPLAEIERSPYQPRSEFRDEELNELAESLRNNGLVQPLTVRRNAAGKWELIAGERRLRAAQRAGWTRIQVVVRQVDDLTAAAMTTTENLQREDLNPIEEAVSYRTLQDHFSLTQQEVADRVGKSRPSVANALRLLELPDEVRHLVEDRLLSVGHAKVLLSLDDEKKCVLMARECADHDYSVSDLTRRVKRLLEPLPAEPKNPPSPDIPPHYVRTIENALREYFGTAVRLTSSVKFKNGRRAKGVLSLDFATSDDLDRILRQMGVVLKA